jgi:hypothetical protein
VHHIFIVKVGLDKRQALVRCVKVTVDRKYEYLHKLPGVQVMPYEVIDINWV